MAIITRRLPAGGGLAASRSTEIGVGVTTLAIGAMAVDHLMGDDPGLEDPPMFLIASGLSLALAACLFGRVVPGMEARPGADGRVGRVALLCSVVAIFPGIATLWMGLPFVLAGAGVALGLHVRRCSRSDRRAGAAIVLGAVVLVGATVAYLVQAVDKLG